MKQILLTDEEMERAFLNHLSNWALAGYDDSWGDNGMAKDTYGVIRKAQLQEVLKRFHGTTNWVAIVEQMEKECGSQE